jgi:integrase
MSRARRGGGFVSPCRWSVRELLSLDFAARRAFGQQFPDDHEIVGEHRSGDEQGEAIGAFGAAALHAATAHQYRDASLDAGAKALALLKRRRPFESLALWRLVAAALGNAHRRNGALRARRYVLLAEETAIRAVEIRSTAERAVVALERRHDMNFVRRVSLEDLILGDQTDGAFGSVDARAVGIGRGRDQEGAEGRQESQIRRVAG